MTDDLSVYGLGALPDAPDERDYPLSALYASESLTASVVLPASYAAPGPPGLLRPRVRPRRQLCRGPMSGDEPGVIAITQRELLLELREDIRGLKATVDAIARDQALGVERRANMQRSADSIYARLDAHDRDLDQMQAWQHRADGAMVLARWALGASLVSLVAVALQVLAAVGHAMSGGIP